MIHILKTDSEVFRGVKTGVKRFEIRKNDRNFGIGDCLMLKETHYTDVEMREGAPLEYTGRFILAEVTYILHGPIYGLIDGWVIMGIAVDYTGRECDP